MADGVRRHHQFKSVKIGQDLIADKFCLAAFTVFVRVFLHRCFQSLGGKRQRAARGIKQCHLRARQTVGKIEMGF